MDPKLPPRLIPFFTAALRIGVMLRTEAMQLTHNYNSPTEGQILANFAKELDLLVAAHLKKAASPIILVPALPPDMP
jgi:hypothetical protein